MSNGRLEGVIRWSAMSPDLAIISRGTEDYFASFMDLTTPVRPANGDRVVFTPQLVNGRYKARKITFKPKPQDNPQPKLKPIPQPKAKTPRPPAGQSPAAKPVSQSMKPVLTGLAKCPGCLSMVKPRHIRISKAKFKKQCPKCSASMGGASESSPLLGLVAIILLGVAVLSWVPGWSPF